MYFFYSLTCLKLKVPRAAKQLLTTMQITQVRGSAQRLMRDVPQSKG
jgi:hypothetical protein